LLIDGPAIGNNARLDAERIEATADASQSNFNTGIHPASIRRYGDENPEATLTMVRSSHAKSSGIKPRTGFMNLIETGSESGIFSEFELEPGSSRFQHLSSNLKCRDRCEPK